MTLRYHLASLGAVLLALAAGIVAGLAAGPGAGDPTTPVATPTATTAATADAGEPGEAERVLAESVPAVVAGSLGDVDVTLLVLTDEAAEAAAVLEGDLDAAGATTTGSVVLTEAFVDPAEESLRTGLSGQLGTDGDPATPGSARDDLADILGRALLASEATGGTARERAATATTVLGVLSGAGLARGTVEGPADALLVVAPAGFPEADLAAWGSAVAGISEVGDVVLAAPSRAAAEQDPSLVEAVRTSPAGTGLSTVDHADTGLGRVAAVRALAALPSGARGHYGSLRGADSGAPAAR